jgi:hypothetical protein
LIFLVLRARENQKLRVVVLAKRRAPAFVTPPRVSISVMTLELSEDEKIALAAELKRAISEDRFPLSARRLTLKAILAKIEPAPAAVKPLVPPKHYEPPHVSLNDAVGAVGNPI